MQKIETSNGTLHLVPPTGSETNKKIFYTDKNTGEKTWCQHVPSDPKDDFPDIPENIRKELAEIPDSTKIGIHFAWGLGVSLGWKTHYFPDNYVIVETNENKFFVYNTFMANTFSVLNLTSLYEMWDLIRNTNVETPALDKEKYIGTGKEVYRQLFQLPTLKFSTEYRHLCIETFGEEAVETVEFESRILR